jgi:GNAT superfamily N-acetyltransferase
MRVSLPDRPALGPRTATPADLEALNQLFADAFTDRYHRDGLVGVRVPQLNPRVWDYAMQDAGDGAMLWFDEDDRIVAFNMTHASGAEGWMGPLAVRPDRQEAGLGQTIVRAGIDWLDRQGVSVIGLETMPRTVDNIGFYSRLGFEPHHLTITLVGTARARGDTGSRRLSGASPQEQQSLIDACGASLEQAAPGFNYRREMVLTRDLQIGDTVVVEDARGVCAFAVCHHVALAVGRRSEELRVLKLFATSLDAFRTLMMGVEELARDCRVGHVALRCQTVFVDAYRALVAADYQVRWTDLRMTLFGRSEPSLEGDAILLSNWEI